MPEISRFLGIVIMMYFNDHNPPHFRVRYRSTEHSSESSRGSFGKGSYPRAFSVLSWSGARCTSPLEHAQDG